MPDETIVAGFNSFGSDLRDRFHAGGGGDEAQIVGPVATLVQQVGRALGKTIVTTPETTAEDLGRPDIGIHVDGSLCGYVELKAPGTGVNVNRYTGHNRDQWRRFSKLPNVLYCDGISWALFRSGEQWGDRVRFSGDPTQEGPNGISEQDQGVVTDVLAEFLGWAPIVPTSPRALANVLAPLCRYLAIDVHRNLGDSSSALQLLLTEWRALLFPEASTEQFADAYAQTLTFALLLARVEGSHLETFDDAVSSLRSGHGLLAEVLRTLATSPEVHEEVGVGIRILQRTIAAVDPTALRGQEHDVWLYFYEDFLSEYDPRLREDRGAYYTPAQVVSFQVSAVQDLLINRLDKSLGFADEGVVTLDPAAGSGTYPLAVIEQALDRVGDVEGGASATSRAAVLAEQVCAFEILVGPYAVCQLRMTQALLDAQQPGSDLPSDSPKVYLTDTLDSPTSSPRGQTTLLQRPLAIEHERAQEIKDERRVMVCLGNPPYDDQRNAEQARKGGWVRFGEEDEESGIFEDFLEPARRTGNAGYVRYAYNDYLYFWRWATWKVCEHNGDGPGIVSFISASSYLAGRPYVGVREHLRREFDEIWVVDLEGDSFGPNQTENVFAIRTPVAIAIAARFGPPSRNEPATVRYAKMEGSRAEKLAELGATASLDEIDFEDCPSEWQAPFRPGQVGDFATWPELTKIMPWQSSGTAVHRTWPIAPTREVLGERWDRLMGLEGQARSDAFIENRDREIGRSYRAGIRGDRSESRAQPVSSLRSGAPRPPIERYGYRPFDRMWLLADNRLIDYVRPSLWWTQSEGQVFFTTLTTTRLGEGPAIFAAAEVPDFNFFNNRACQVIPLYRSPDSREANVDEALLAILSDEFDRSVDAEEMAAYIYGVMGHEGYFQRFRSELESPGPRVPITTEPELFAEVAEAGRELIAIHTFGARGTADNPAAHGRARVAEPIPGGSENYPGTPDYDEQSETIRIGDGAIAPVAPAVWEYSISGHRVLRSWLNQRLEGGAGQQESVLDEILPEAWLPRFTTELLEVIWALESSVERRDQLSELLGRVVESTLIADSDLPDPAEEMTSRPIPRSSPTGEQLSLE